MSDHENNPIEQFKMINPAEILTKLDRYGLQGFSHSDQGLISHLLGTFQILQSWKCSDNLCIAGLCHSIYGTESYRRTPIELNERENIKSIIGSETEQLVYLFGAHVKDSLWENLALEKSFKIKDRLTNQNIDLNFDHLSDLITLTLANWLEQRPRVSQDHLYIRQDEFLSSEKYLPIQAFLDFKKSYGL